MFEKKTKKRKKKKKGGFKHSFLKLKIRLLKPKVHVCLKMSTKKKKKNLQNAIHFPFLSYQRLHDYNMDENSFLIKIIN